MVQEVCYIPDVDINRLNRIFSKTILSTRLWQLLRHFNLIKESRKKLDYYNQVEQFTDPDATYFYLTEIKKMAEAAGATFLLVPVPNAQYLDQRPDVVLKWMK